MKTISMFWQITLTLYAIYTALTFSSRCSCVYGPRNDYALYEAPANDLDTGSSFSKTLHLRTKPVGILAHADARVLWHEEYECHIVAAQDHDRRIPLSNLARALFVR